MSDARTIEVYTEKAEDYIKLTATSGPDADLQAFIALMPEAALVLDLGCGPGTSAAHMRAAGLTPVAIDASEGMVELANKTFALGATLGTFDDVVEVDHYDGIWANFSLLHAAEADLPRYLKAIAVALKPGGVFHIGMKCGTGTKRDHIDRLYTFVTPSGLQELLRDAGLSVIATREGIDKGMAGTMDPFVICLARKDG